MARLTATLLLAVLGVTAACSRMRPVLNVEGHPLLLGDKWISRLEKDIDRSLERTLSEARS